MKNILVKMMMAGALVAVSASSLAATEVIMPGTQQVVGHISASGARNLDELVAALGQKADLAGASAFHITSANGKNTFSGTAELLK
ncbi:MAG: DUF1471 domain-containing protein [Pantoea sp.]|uniref:DUF1471 domain-containing protein n=1 Tax=Pantoea phytobeneficialis TaxID=2052056 RepID=A0AAP9H6B3_9GAMM|nr:MULTISPECIES: DUF1471 domain-containing protein [Pantoea]ERK13866.1 hypothetical protein L579_0196 [Pantoea sp. AS-PWVM4]MDO6409548.1 DUF1471 domain-containing protein [Pantoea phytobeneficialis]QGR07372.1 DUF1471 domain-containing protein [Pantoea phytobeneficialis]